MDPSVADREDGDVPDKPADWRPDFEISNAVDLEEVIEPATIWDSSGLVRMAIRYRGTVFQPMDALDFPFDRHAIWIKCGPAYSRADEIVYSAHVDRFWVGNTLLGSQHQLPRYVANGRWREATRSNSPSIITHHYTT